MRAARNLIWILMTMFLLACEKGATCASLGDYVFTAEPNVFQISAGNNYSFEMTFYPIPTRRMRFSDDSVRHISIRSDWYGWERGGENPETLPESQIDVLEIGAEVPLRFDVQFQSEFDGESLVLDFGLAGKLRDVPTGENIPLQIALLPMSACLIDSNDIYALADILIETR